MKKILILLLVSLVFVSCSEGSDNPEDSFDNTDNPENPTDPENPEQTFIYDAPNVRSYATYKTTNTARLNGFIDLSNITFSQEDYYNVGFIFREGDFNDTNNDIIIELEGEVEFKNGTYSFFYDMDQLEPNTTYYYSAFTKNGDTEERDWEEFISSDIACNQTQDNQYTYDGISYTDYNAEIFNPQCCDEGSFGIRFGTWPNIFDVKFNEIDADYPITAQYFGVSGSFDITNIDKELVKSTNQVLIDENRSDENTNLFVENDGSTISLIFCNTVMNNGKILDGKISVDIP